MAASTSLPPPLRRRLNAVARRVRLTRLVWGMSVLALVLTLAAAGCLLADHFLRLDAAVRFGLLLGWAGLGLLTLLFALVLPLSRRLDPASLAAFIEQRYPDLAERLTSAVELAGAHGPHHGSPTLISLLLADTAERTERLRVTRAVRAGIAVACAAAALGVVGAAAFSAVLRPATFAQLATRFFAPWQTPAVVPEYAVESLTGDVVVGRGRPLTLAARVVPLREDVPPAPECVLVFPDADGQLQRREMKLAADGEAFQASLDHVPAGFRYHLQSGSAVSDTFTVTAVEPVALAPEYPVTTVTAPEYARATITETTFKGKDSLTPLQHSRIKLELKLTQPAAWALVRWTAADQKIMVKPILGTTAPVGQAAGQNQFRLSVKGFNADNDIPPSVLGELATGAQPIRLADDRLSGAVELDADANGSLHLLLVTEHGIDTRVGPIALTIKPDQPPAFHKVGLSEQIKAVLPGDRVPLEFTVLDDVAVAGALLEYKVNDGEVKSEVIPLTGANTREATAKHLFALPADLKEGTEVRFRLKAMDNRRLPEKQLGPQEVYYPDKDRWLTLKIAATAKPLQEQEILAQRDAINKKLDKLWDDLRHEQRGVYNLRQEAKKETALSPANLNKLTELQKENLNVKKELLDLARDAAQAPDLQKVADAARDLADQEISRAADGLRQVERGNQPEPREEKLIKVDGELDRALQKIEALRKANNQAAQERLDKAKLEAAAQKQKDLADRTADLASEKEPDPKLAQQLQKEQGDLANELQKLAEQSDALRDALDAARGEQAKELADKARDLAQQQRELAETKLDDPQRRQQLAELARKQQDLAEKAAKLAKETQPAAKAAQTTPLRPEDAQKAVENLKQGDAGEAVKNQDQTAKDLDRLAADLDRALELAKDPREAARQLARMQQALQQKLAEEKAKVNDPKPLAERLAELQKEQDALRNAVENLDVPEQYQLARTARQEARDRAADAGRALKSTTLRQAEAQMEESRQALERLAQNLPTAEQRQRIARDALAQLRQQQEQTAQLAEQALKPFENADPNAAQTRKALAEKLTEAMRKQAEAAEKLSKLDAPGQEPRQQRAEDALNQALRDLMEARPQDIPASQQAAKRELERLEQALQGKPVADEPVESDSAKAERLARKQAEEAAEAERLARKKKEPDPDAAERLKRRAQELKELRAGDEAQREKQEALRRLSRAQQARPEEQAKAQQEAADALRDLADKLAGRQTSAEKAAELARQQRELATEAEKPDGKPSLDRQQDLARQLERLDPKGAEELRKQAAEQMDAARKALEQGQDPARAKEPLGKAADSAEKLAKELAQKQAAQQKPPDQPQQQQAAKPGESPQKLAQELATRQRDLMKQTQKARDDLGFFPGQKDRQKFAETLDRINQQQQQLNRQASELPANGMQKTLEQAREAMNQAGQALEKKDGYQAQAKQREAAEALQRLAQNLPQQANNPQAQPGPQGPLNKQQSEQARDLARQQRELRDQAQKLTQQQPDQAPQQNLEKRANDLMQQLQKLAQQMKQQPQAQQSAEQAAQQAQQAQQQMQQAQKQAQQGNEGQQQQAQKQAAEALERAAQQARQAGQQMKPQPGQQPTPEAGQAVQQAQNQMRQAEMQLGQGQPQDAKNAMQQAAELLKQAAQQLGRSSQQAQNPPSPPTKNTEPGPTGPAGEGRVDASLLSPDMKKQYEGKRWGELSGEQQTQYLQALRDRYGDDYARIIKLYFEQLASTRAPARQPPAPPRR